LFRELKDDFFAGELFVHGGVRVQLVLNVRLHRLVQVDLQEARRIESDSGALSDDFGRVAQVVQDRVVDRSQSSAEWPLLLLVAGLSGRLGQDAALSEDDDVFARKLLLELSDNLLLDLLPRLDLWKGHKDRNRLSAAANFELLGCLEVEFLERRLEVWSAVVFDLDERLRGWSRRRCTFRPRPSKS